MSTTSSISNPDRYNEATMRDARALICALLPQLQSRAERSATRWLAEDAVQEACERLLSHASTFIAHPNPRAYAIRTLVTTLIDQQRRRQREVPAAEVPDDPGQAPGNPVESRWEAERLLAALPTGQASAVRLVDVEGFTIDQAAKILGVHRGTVSRARLRGLEALRRNFFLDESYRAPA